MPATTTSILTLKRIRPLNHPLFPVLFTNPRDCETERDLAA